MDLRLENDFSASVQVQLIRIVQEALTNVRKHAQAGRVRLVGMGGWTGNADRGDG